LDAFNLDGAVVVKFIVRRHVGPFPSIRRL
jgi:hypothetical protein